MLVAITQIPSLGSVQIFFLLIGAMLIGGLVAYWIFQKRMERLSQLFNTDPVTGLYSSTVIEKLLSFDIERAKRYKQDISLALFEIDDFVDIEDPDDETLRANILKHFSGIITEGIKYSDKEIKEFHGLRTSDAAFSCVNNDRILIIMPETNTKGAYTVAERLREAVMHSPYQAPDSAQLVSITVSASLVGYQGKTDSSEDMLKRAHSLLDIAKRTTNLVIADERQNHDTKDYIAARG